MITMVFAWCLRTRAPHEVRPFSPGGTGTGGCTSPSPRPAPEGFPGLPRGGLVVKVGISNPRWSSALKRSQCFRTDGRLRAIAADFQTLVGGTANAKVLQE